MKRTGRIANLFRHPFSDPIDLQAFLRVHLTEAHVQDFVIQRIVALVVVAVRSELRTQYLIQILVCVPPYGVFNLAGGGIDGRKAEVCRVDL